MLVAKRRLADCLHLINRTKTPLSFVQRPSSSTALGSRSRDFRGHRSILFPGLVQKAYRKTKTPSSGAYVKGRLSHQTPACSDEQFIDLIDKEIGRVEKSLRHSEFPEFAKNLREKFRSWDRKAELPLLTTLREADYERCATGQSNGLRMQIHYLFYGDLANRSHSKSDIVDQGMLADLRFPVDWYPATREIQRSIHLHVGPTNSGKTYQALKRLEKAKSGIYAGPLRLLAHEVYMRLNNKGIPCHLITGDQRVIKEGEGVDIASCTVEMVPLNHDVEVAIIDEIQMIGDEFRGWAWTQALLGLKAKELHLCGEARTVPLIRELTTLMGDKLEVHHYERLSPLETMNESLNGDSTKFRKGDCIVVFSKIGLNAMKIIIERQTNKRVAIIYGDLPPELRAQQARLFNDPNNDYDFLVASDAIGMGLNLKISRIVFYSSVKKQGKYWTSKITDDQIKQIGGRAGRYRVALQTEDEGVSQEMHHDAVPKPAGLVTSFDPVDFANIIQGMQSAPTPVMTAGILPPSDIVSNFAAYFPPDTPFGYLLRRIQELARINPRFHHCGLREQAKIADMIEPVKNLTIRDRLTLTAAPVARTDHSVKVCRAFAQCIANNGGGGLLEIKELDLTILDIKDDKSLEYQSSLEGLHKSLTLYLWLGYRFEGIFHSRAMALYVQGLIQERMEKCLAHRGGEKKRKGQKFHAGDILNRNSPNGGDGGPNKPRHSVLPQEAGFARSTQHPIDNILDLDYPWGKVSEIRPLEATASCNL